MIKFARILLVVSVLFCAAPQAAEDDVMLNFVNADIESVIKAVGLISGKNFLIDPRVKGTINIVSSKPVSRSLTYPILLSALRLQGFAALESSGITKIVPEADAKLHYGLTVGEKVPAGNNLITQVYALKHESAQQMLPILRPLISPNNTIAAYPNNNTLVITDYADNIKRIDSIIDSVDQPGGTPVIVALQHASALDVAQAISKLMAESGAAGASTDPGQRLAVVPDSRTNSLVLRSGNPSWLTMAQNLAERMDKSTGESGNIHVVYLKNADAVKLAQTLRSAMTGEAPAAPAAPGAAAAQSSPSSSGGGMIQADAPTNSLVITAPEPVYNNLRAVIDKLDSRRAQIFVEALIVEVTADKAAEFGIQWQQLNGVNKTTAQLIGGTNFGPAGTNIIGTAGNIGTAGQGLNIGIIRGQVNVPGLGNVLNLGMLARALETDANANILSTPNLLTLDNEEAKIVVGQNVPFTTGSYAQTGNVVTASPFQTYERKDVGLTLKIKPQISQSGSVRLQIYQEVSSVNAATVNNPAGPTTNKRSIESSVVVDDGQIIVLGGLIQDSVSDGTNQVPLLGDIPVLGNLFKYKNQTHSKTNLMVFLRPYVLRDSKAYTGLTEDRYEYIAGEGKKMEPSKHLILPDINSPSLPPLRDGEKKAK